MLDTQVYEAEIKLPVDNLEEVKRSLINKGATYLKTETQIDTYYAHPCRSFSETDEAFRTRVIHCKKNDTLTTTNEATYKGPKIDEKTKTRIETSTTISELASFVKLLEHLSFERVAKIEKTRMFYTLDNITIGLDDVKNLGGFIELECIIDEKAKLESASKALFALAKELALPLERTIRESYLELLLSQE